jgi:hypothetical protein
MFPSSSSSHTEATSPLLEYPYLSRITFVIVTSSEDLNLRVSRSETELIIALLPAAGVALTAKSPDLTTTSVGSSVDSLDLQATGQSLYSPSASSNAQITFTSVSSHADGVSHSLLMSINITYPLTSFVDSALAI